MINLPVSGPRIPTLGIYNMLNKTCSNFYLNNLDYQDNLQNLLQSRPLSHTFKIRPKTAQPFGNKKRKRRLSTSQNDNLN